MKNILKSILLSLALITCAYAGDEPKETTKVCVDVVKDGKPVMDKKTGKPQQQCKTMKVHKKLEGTAVPEKK
jgi:hypothetical protein